MSDWTLGFDIELLRAVADCFKQHDEGLTFGAFTAVKEATVARAMKAGTLQHEMEGERCVAACIGKTRSRATSIADFTGQPRQAVPSGAFVVDRVAWRRGYLEQAVGMCENASVLHLWQEKADDWHLAEALGMTLSCVKIRASSELVGVFRARGLPEPRLQHPAEQIGLRKLASGLDVGRTVELLRELAPSFEQHYSSYNKRGSWTAIALRGFSDDPRFIQKPAEMSKGWKAENPQVLEAGPRWTSLWQQFEPVVAPLLAELPASSFERVRFMQLAPGGALSRHADITDRDAGLEDGAVARLHVPLVTNDEVLFQQWKLNGSAQTERMGEGELWYLDIRKPHAARNAGEAPRVHLVVDCFSSERLRTALC